MKQSNIVAPPPVLKLAKTFLETIGPAPWEVSINGALHKLDDKSLTRLPRMISEAAAHKRNIHFVMPCMDGMVQHLAITAPSGKPISGDAPQITLMADGMTHIWLLGHPIPIAEANKMSARLARNTPDAKPAVTNGVPLPGSMLFKSKFINLTYQYAVQMLPPSRTRYTLVNGHLARPARVSTTHDPRALSVNLGNDQSGQPVHWTPGQQANGFVLVLGASGSGKTVTLRRLGAGVHDYGVPVLVLDFHGDVTLPGVRDILLSSGTDSTRGLNPMEIDAVSGRESGLFDQRGELREMIMRACNSLGHRQGNVLREAIEQAYLRAGIQDNDPASWANNPPTFPDLIRILNEMTEADGANRNAIEGVIASAYELFGHPIFGRTDHIGIDEILGRSTRLDLSKLSDGVRFVTAESLLLRIFRVLRNRGPIPLSPVDDSERFRLFVIIDEAKILAMGGGRNILDAIYCEARKFGVGMILASQAADHFSDDIKNNAATWLVLKPGTDAEAKKNAPNIQVEPEALKALRGKGDAYYRGQAAGAACRIQVRAL